MSRDRFVDPGIWKSEQVCAVQPVARLLFVGLITESDDFGFFTASPHTIRLEIFPGDSDITNGMVEAWRDELIGSGLVQLYEAEGKGYLWIPTFERWQRMRYHAKSRILETLEASGAFGVENDGKNRPIKCWPKVDPVEPKHFRCNENVSVATESSRSRGVPCRGVVSRAVDGGAAPRAPAPPSAGNGRKTTATAGIAHVCANGNVNGGNGNGKQKPKLFPQRAKVNQLLGTWRKQPNDFLRWDDLLAEALAKCDEPIYLAHVIDVDQCAICWERKPAALWARLHPPDDDPDRKPIIPSDAAMIEAKRILDAGLEKIAGQLAVDIGKSAKLRPPARKRRT